jgi:hypothetical protein
MRTLDLIAERRIREAIERGELKDLPGEGRPLELDDDGLVPEDTRAINRVLKNAGFVPPEVQALREAAQLNQTLAETGAVGAALAEPGSISAADRRRGVQRLALLRTRIEAAYLDRVIDRLSRRAR